MDIDLLSKMVKELILDNDKVVLPGLGAFVAEMVPATFSDKGYTINPPYRRLYFRAKPDEGDSLIKFYASSNGVDFAVADKVIRDFVSELKSVLFIRKTVAFPGLGRLRATKENAVFFVADEDLDIYPEGIGLEPISLKTHQETKEEVAAAIVELKSIVENPDPVMEGTEVVMAPEVVEVQQTVETPELQETIEIPEVAVEEEVGPVEDRIVEKVSVPESMPVSKKRSGVLKAFLWIASVLILLLVAYVLVAHMYPHVLDQILYTPEELEILNR